METYDSEITPRERLTIHSNFLRASGIKSLDVNVGLRCAMHTVD